MSKPSSLPVRLSVKASLCSLWSDCPSANCHQAFTPTNVWNFKKARSPLQVKFAQHCPVHVLNVWMYLFCLGWGCMVTSYQTSYDFSVIFLIMAFKKESNLIRITFNKVLIFCFLCWRLDVSFLFFLLQHYTFWRSSLVPVLQDIKKSFFQSKFIICFWGIYFF